MLSTWNVADATLPVNEKSLTGVKGKGLRPKCSVNGVKKSKCRHSDPMELQNECQASRA